MAVTKWRGAGKKWTLKTAQAVETIDLQRMNTQERAELAQFYRNQFGIRLRQFTKAGTIGYAVHKLTADMEEMSEKLNTPMNPLDPVVTAKGKTRQLASNFADRKNPQNALATYITLMQDFFSAKSSTVKGWQSIGEDQDRRLFGESPVIGKRGKPLKRKQINYRMTDKERINFWKVYREISKADGYFPLSANYAAGGQSDFATLWMTGDLKTLDFEAAYKKMQELFGLRLDSLPENPPGQRGNHTAQGNGGDTEHDDSFDDDAFV